MYANGIVQPSAGPTGIKQMFGKYNPTTTPTLDNQGWVTNSGEVWTNMAAPTQIVFPEGIVGVFTDNTGAWYGMGASGSYYPFTDPTIASGSMGEPMVFCGFVPERIQPYDPNNGDAAFVSYGAFYATGNRTSVYRRSVAQAKWQPVVLSNVKTGNPGLPAISDIGGAVFSTTATPLPLNPDNASNGVFLWNGAPVT